MAEDPNEWQSKSSRQKAIQHIEEAIRVSGNPTNKTSSEMESHVFQRAKTRDEYLGFLGRLILLIKKHKHSGDPMNALQSLTVQQQQQQQQQQFQQQQQSMYMQVPQKQLVNPQQPGQDPGPGIHNVGMANMCGPMTGSHGGPMGMVQHFPQQQQQQQQRMQMVGQMGMAGPGMIRQMSPAPGPSPVQQQQQQLQQQQQAMGSRGMSPAMTAVPGGALAPQHMSPAFVAPSPGSVSGSHGYSPMSACTMQGSVRGAMGPSPGQVHGVPSPQLNTPSGAGGSIVSPSPRTPHDDSQYMEKVRQLSKYIEPIKRMIESTSQQDTAKQGKMRKLLDILENPSRQYSVELLVKCEQVLEKLEINQSACDQTAAGNSNAAGNAAYQLPLQKHHTNHKEYQVILDTVNLYSRSPALTHTLCHTIGPTYNALRGCTLQLPEPISPEEEEDDDDYGDYGGMTSRTSSGDVISLVLQRELATMPAYFTVEVDHAVTIEPGASLRLCVQLRQQWRAPCVAPLRVLVPPNYPDAAPQLLSTAGEDAFSRDVLTRLRVQVCRLGDVFSLSQMLEQWRMAVRQTASADRRGANTPPVSGQQDQLQEIVRPVVEVVASIEEETPAVPVPVPSSTLQTAA